MHKKIRFGLALTWTCAVVVLSLISFSQAPKAIVDFASYDKVAHFVFYLVFVFLWGSYIFYKEQIQTQKLFFLFFVALIFAGVIEVCQELFTERRTADRYDMLANFVGALSGMATLYFYKKYKKKL